MFLLTSGDTSQAGFYLVPSATRVNPHFEEHCETWLPAIQYPLICEGFIECVFEVADADKIEYFCPQRLTANELEIGLHQ